MSSLLPFPSAFICVHLRLNPWIPFCNPNTDTKKGSIPIS